MLWLQRHGSTHGVAGSNASTADGPDGPPRRREDGVEKMQARASAMSHRRATAADHDADDSLFATLCDDTSVGSSGTDSSSISSSRSSNASPDEFPLSSVENHLNDGPRSDQTNGMSNLCGAQCARSGGTQTALDRPRSAPPPTHPGALQPAGSSSVTAAAPPMLLSRHPSSHHSSAALMTGVGLALSRACPAAAAPSRSTPTSQAGTPRDAASSAASPAIIMAMPGFDMDAASVPLQRSAVDAAAAAAVGGGCGAPADGVPNTRVVALSDVHHGVGDPSANTVAGSCTRGATVPPQAALVTLPRRTTSQLPLLPSPAAAPLQSSRRGPPLMNVIVVGAPQVGKSALINAYRLAVTHSAHWPVAPVGRCGQFGTACVAVMPSSVIRPVWALIDTPGKVYGALHDEASDDSVFLAHLFAGVENKAKILGRGAVRATELPPDPDNAAHHAIVVVSATDLLHDRGKFHVWNRYIRSSGAPAILAQLADLMHTCRDLLEDTSPLLVVTHMDALCTSMWVGGCEAALREMLACCVPVDNIFFVGIPPGAVLTPAPRRAVSPFSDDTPTPLPAALPEATAEQLMLIHQRIKTEVAWRLRSNTRCSTTSSGTILRCIRQS